MAHEHRLEILECLAQGARSVEALADRCGLPIANMSQHLQHLRRAGLVKTSRDGKYVLYQLADDEIIVLLSSLQRVAEAPIACWLLRRLNYCVSEAFMRDVLKQVFQNGRRRGYRFKFNRIRHLTMR